uniref:Uncharacterized protein n=1 Tax=Tetradesmus obliquus TaxID=3088 RepID=A0A383VTP7_TETOB|eukprot:jgi/Sobl393_1/3166/SZX68867.1
MLLLQQAVQLAAPLPAAAAAAAAAGAGAGAAIVQQQQGGLRLSSFSSNWRGSPELLGALPAHSMTKLQLDLGIPSRKPTAASYGLDGAVTSAALARLSSLWQLTLADTNYMCRNAVSCLAAVAQLTRLTLLDLAACMDYALAEIADDHQSDAELPQLLAGLSQLRVLRLPARYREWPALDLTHMTQLLVLCNSYRDMFSHGLGAVQLPAQLDFGRMRYEHQLEAVLQLQQLRHLVFRCDLGV